MIHLMLNRRFEGITLNVKSSQRRSIWKLFRAAVSLECFTFGSSNLKARKYMARYNPLRLFHTRRERAFETLPNFRRRLLLSECGPRYPKEEERYWRSKENLAKSRKIFPSPCTADIHRIHLFSSNSSPIYVTTLVLTLTDSQEDY